MQEIIVGIVVVTSLYIVLHKLYKSVTSKRQACDTPTCQLGCPGCHLGKHAKPTCEGQQKEENTL